MRGKDVSPMKRTVSDCVQELCICTYIENWEFCQDAVEFFFKGVLSKLDFSHIKVSYPTNFEVFMNDLDNRLVSIHIQLELKFLATDCWCLPLCLVEDDVQEVSRRRNGRNALERFCCRHYSAV